MASDIWELFDPAIAPRDGDLGAYLGRALTTCATLFMADGASIFLREEGGIYRLKAQTGIEPPIPADATIVHGEGVGGACLELLKPLLVNQIASEPIFDGRNVEPRADLGTSMVVPLLAPSGPALGVLNLSRKAGAQSFENQDLTHAASLAHQIALAVSAACLLADSRQAHDWLQGVIECVPAAVLALGTNGELGSANEAGKLLLENAPDWLSGELKAGQNRISDPGTGKVWRVQCHSAGEGRVIVAQDITDQEREAAEESRMRRLAEIGQMSAAVAHEIRNPLTGIRAAAQMVVQCPEQAPELAQIIEEEVIKLNDLCEEFLDFARPLYLSKKPCRMSDLVRRVSFLESVDFEAANVKLVLEGPEETPTIQMDGARAEQVMRNLLRNARQACQPEDRTTLRYTADTFEIEDTGSGMSEESLEKLFVPFFTTKPQGTGLGLSTVRKIVDAHGGKLGVRSRIGAGTCFEIAFQGSL